MKRFIGIDCDGILCDGFQIKLIEFYGKHTKGSPLVIDELHEDIRHYFKNGDVPWQLGRDYVLSEGFVESFEPIPEALKFIDDLRKNNIYFKIVTAPFVGAKYWSGERAEWLRKHFDMKADDIIFARDKTAVGAYTLIDDKVSNCVDFSKENKCLTFLKERPWNKDVGLPCVYKSSQINAEWHYLMAEPYPSIIKTDSFDYILEKVIKLNKNEKIEPPNLREKSGKKMHITDYIREFVTNLR